MPQWKRQRDTRAKFQRLARAKALTNRLRMQRQAKQRYLNTQKNSVLKAYHGKGAWPAYRNMHPTNRDFHSKWFFKAQQNQHFKNKPIYQGPWVPRDQYLANKRK